MESALRASGRFKRQDQSVSALLNEGVGAFFGLAHGWSPSWIEATDLNENVTRSSLGSVALNIADLAEHAIDAVPDRVALISGDEQLTYAQLEEKANRLAHYLIDQGVKKDDKVGLYCRNRIEIVIAMLGIVKAGAILVNVNFRYVEGELKYLFENSDMVALVHERRYADRVANVLPETPNVKTILAVEDGSDDDFQRYGGVEFYSALEQGSPDRDFGERSADDIYLLYTGGTTGFPKGVMWRHEDIYRVLFGGTDFATGEFVKDEYDLAKAAAENPPMIRYPIPPMIHGATQSATWMSLFSGQTMVLAPEFDADEVWQTIEKHKVNLLFFTGDAMARPLLDALTKLHDGGHEPDLSSLFLLASTAALFSTSIKEKFLELLPNRVITDSIGSSETGFGGTSIVAKGQSHTGGPRVTIDHRTVVLDEDGNEVKPGSGVRGMIAKKGNIPVGYYKDEKKTAETFKTFNGVRYAIPGDYAEVDEDGSVTMLGRGSQSINSGGEKIYPEEVEAALKGHPDVFDALGGRCARRALRQLRRRRRAPPPRHQPVAGRTRHVRAPGDRGIQSAAQGLVGRRDPPDTGRQARLPVGQGHHRGAARRRRARQPCGNRNLMRTELCDRFGIDYPIFVFTPSEKVAAAVSKAGGLGVLGCVRFNEADDLENVLCWMDENTDGKPYGVDIVMPAKVPQEGSAVDIDKLIPQSHRDFVTKTLADLGVPPLPDDEERNEGVLGWLHSVARSHVEVALQASDQADRQRARLAARRTSSTRRTRPACRWPRWRAAPSTRSATSRTASTSWWRRATRPAATPVRSVRWCCGRKSLTRLAVRRPCWRRAASAPAGRWPPRWRSARKASGWARRSSRPPNTTSATASRAACRRFRRRCCGPTPATRCAAGSTPASPRAC